MSQSPNWRDKARQVEQYRRQPRAQVLSRKTLQELLSSEGSVSLFFIIPIVVYFFLVAAIPPI